MIMKLTRLAVVLVCTLVHVGAWAHTSLRESVPKADAVLTTVPDLLELRFSEPVRLTAWFVRDDQGNDTPLDPHESGGAAHFTVDTPALAAGRYTIHWRVISTDTHVVSGEIAFAISAPEATSGAAEHDGHDTRP